jgi:tetratricopeptide (TPR) repeat protein
MHEFEGQVLNLMGRFQDTTIYFPRVRIINPDYYSPTLAHAYVKTSEYAKAISEYEGYLAGNPEDAAAYASLGEIYLASKEYAGAVAALKKAVDIDPGNQKYRYLYGLGLEREGHKKDAVNQFKKAIQLDPNSDYAKSARELLNLPSP